MNWEGIRAAKNQGRVNHTLCFPPEFRASWIPRRAGLPHSQPDRGKALRPKPNGYPGRDEKGGSQPGRALPPSASQSNTRRHSYRVAGTEAGLWPHPGAKTAVPVLMGQNHCLGHTPRHQRTIWRREVTGQCVELPPESLVVQKVLEHSGKRLEL